MKGDNTRPPSVDLVMTMVDIATKTPPVSGSIDRAPIRSQTGISVQDNPAPDPSAQTADPNGNPDPVKPE